MSIDASQLQNDIEQILTREQAWAQAHRTLDLAAMQDILADGFIKLSSDANLIDKDQLLEGYDSESRQWYIAESSDHHVWIHGEVGVVVGRWYGKGQNQDPPFDYSARFIAIYLKQEGDWRLLSEHSVPIKEEQLPEE